MPPTPASVAPLDNSDLSQGIVITLVGEQPTPDEPMQCPTNPATGASDDSRLTHINGRCPNIHRTKGHAHNHIHWYTLCPVYSPAGAPYTRTTKYELKCDASVKGFAILDKAVQDSQNMCLYTLQFRTALACQGPLSILRTLSPGWAFNIVFMVAVTVYVGLGAALSYRKTGRPSLPHTEFWNNVMDLIADGVTYTFTCGNRICQKRYVPKAAPPVFGADGGSSSSGAVFASTKSYTDL